MPRKLKFLFLFLSTFAFSQTEDNFSDGNFTFKPNWIGTDTKFEVTNLYQLRTKDTIADTAYLSVKHNLSTLENQEWRCWIRQSFSPSANNFARYYLTSNAVDLTTNPDGYYLQFGESGTMDAIRLIKSENKITKEICVGTSAAISSNFIISVKVIRESNGTWKLYVDYVGGENYKLDATGTETSNLIGTYSGVYCKYTKTYATRFYFDNFYIGPKIVDKVPPVLQSISTINKKEILLQFNETIDTTGVSSVANYRFINQSIDIQKAKRDSLSTNSIHLWLSDELINATLYNIEVSNLQDIDANKFTSQQKSFYYLVAEKPLPGELIINECMPNPSPPVGLPELEYVEVYNKSDKYFNLDGWILTDGTSKGIIANGWVAPHTYRLLCSTNSLAFMNGALGVTSFPSLNNAGDKLQLHDSTGLLIDQINYTTDWFKDATKSQGGWSLERVNPNHPCSNQDNWKASTHPDGGTPGEQNAVFDTLKPTQGLQIVSANALNNKEVVCTFDRSIDTLTSLSLITQWQPSLAVDTCYFTTNGVRYVLNDAFIPSTNYTLNIQGVKDCWQDSYTVYTAVGLTEQALPNDLIINEILFNPYTDGVDFIEIKNTSSKWIALKDLQLANLNQGKLTVIPVKSYRILKPNEIIFIAESFEKQQIHYPSAQVENWVNNPLPAYNNDSGTVLLLFNNQIIDKVSYQDTWHFDLLNETDGKSLERIDAFGPSNQASNWHTAAETSNFATPGIVNSHSMNTTTSEKKASLQSAIISPDNDGIDDLLTLQFHTDSDTYLATVSIYYPNGTLVKSWLKNTLLGQDVKVNWDGIADNNQKTPIGTYLVYIELLNQTTKSVEKIRIPFVVAGKM